MTDESIAGSMPHEWINRSTHECSFLGRGIYEITISTDLLI